MSAVLNTRDRDRANYVVTRTPTPPGQFRELTLVALKGTAITLEGEEVPIGSLGVVVAAWNAGEAYEVDFSSVGGLATVSADDLDEVEKV